ncbi:MAG: mercury(II) reductase [Oceanospirillaceae bacterium]|nr:mercury(II) reductase [Oceanospirillaceae bacterium]
MKTEQFSIENEGDKPLHIAIIGSGSAAFSCAIQAAQRGATVTIIEADKVIGGCCVNVGCVPSKILIRAAQLAQQQRDNPFIGLTNHTPILNRSQLAMQQHSRVEELRAAKYQQILDNNPRLHLIKGRAHFKDASTLSVLQSNGQILEINADKFLLATGSTPTIPPIDGLAQTPFWTSDDAVFAEASPEHLIIIGSSVIALEMAQAYRRLGSQVTLLARHNLLHQEDPLIGEQLQKCFEQEGICIQSFTQVNKVSFDGKLFNLQTNQGNFSADKLLLSTGRRANTAGLNLAVAGVDIDEGGRILVNNRLQSSAPHIFAAGDCCNLPQYVYVAAAAGSRAGINMTDGDKALDLSVLPKVIFTDPQVATVGLCEAEAVARGIKIDSRVLAMENVPRALANFATEGFIKLVIDAHTKQLIGAQIVAHEGGEIIQSAALAIGNKMTVTDLTEQLFPYLTMVEGLKLCAQTFDKDLKTLSCCAG